MSDGNIKVKPCKKAKKSKHDKETIKQKQLEKYAPIIENPRYANLISRYGIVPYEIINILSERGMDVQKWYPRELSPLEKKWLQPVLRIKRMYDGRFFRGEMRFVLSNELHQKERRRHR
jgi:hypothetical protein